MQTIDLTAITPTAGHPDLIRMKSELEKEDEVSELQVIDLQKQIIHVSHHYSKNNKLYTHSVELNNNNKYFFISILTTFIITKQVNKC